MCLGRGEERKEGEGGRESREGEIERRCLIPETGDTGGCEPPDMGSGNEIFVHWKSSTCF